MDRTAWTAVIVSAIGLVVWYTYMAKQAVPQRVATGATPAQTGASSTYTPLPSVPSTPVAPLATAPAASPSPSATAAPDFVESRETLRNSDVEVQLTNRGGAISEVTLLNHKGID